MTLAESFVAGTSSARHSFLNLYLRHHLSMWPAQQMMAADSGMETRTSPGITDSRKRPSDGDVENGETKRQHCGGGGDGNVYHLKVLVPCVAAGAIIGKGGETIAQLQKDTGARMKMSKANDFYPCKCGKGYTYEKYCYARQHKDILMKNVNSGINDCNGVYFSQSRRHVKTVFKNYAKGTTERVCLITGSVEAIMAVMSFIMEKIKEKPDIVPKPTPCLDTDSKLSADRSKQVKILIPNSTAGMIIGKGGNYIKQIKEESGSYIQLSQKSNDAALQLQERCVTIIGEIANNKKAILKLLAKVVEDPQSGSCPNVSYADISGPIANFNPTGSPYAHSQSPAFCSAASLTSSTIATMLVGGVSLNLSLNITSPSPTTNHSLSPQFFENIKASLRASAYSEQATTDILASLSTLSRYGARFWLGDMSIGLTPTSPTHPTLFTSQYVMESPPAVNGTTSVFGAIGSVGTATPSRGADRYGETPSFDPFRHQPGTTSPITLTNNSLGLTNALSPHAPTLSPSHPDKESKKVETEINEAIVGAILGPGGRELSHIQQLSGANIQISKKGTFAPGTRNRIVTITGLPSAITTAHHLIQQKINDEETKRARQSALSILQ